MDQQPAAVDMPQEIVTQTGALAGSLDDAGNICHDEADAIVYIHHAQIRIQGGKMIIGDLGVCLTHYAEQRGFPHIGKAHQTHIRQQLQLQDHVVALPWQTRLGKAGHLPGGGGKVLVAPAAPAALAKDKRLFIRHILDNFTGLRVPDQGPPGHPDSQALPVLAALAAALAVHSVSGHIFALIAKVHQSGHIVVHLHDDTPPVAAVSAVGSSRRNVFFSVKGHRPVAAVSGPNGNARLVNKSVSHSSTSQHNSACRKSLFAPPPKLLKL